MTNRVIAPTTPWAQRLFSSPITRKHQTTSNNIQPTMKRKAGASVAVTATTTTATTTSIRTQWQRQAQWQLWPWQKWNKEKANKNERQRTKTKTFSIGALNLTLRPPGSDKKVCQKWKIEAPASQSCRDLVGHGDCVSMCILWIPFWRFEGHAFFMWSACMYFCVCQCHCQCRCTRHGSLFYSNNFWQKLSRCLSHVKTSLDILRPWESNPTYESCCQPNLLTKGELSKIQASSISMPLSCTSLDESSAKEELL